MRAMQCIPPNRSADCSPSCLPDKPDRGFDESDRLRCLVGEARQALEKVELELLTLAPFGGVTLPLYGKLKRKRARRVINFFVGCAIPLTVPAGRNRPRSGCSARVQDS